MQTVLRPSFSGVDVGSGPAPSAPRVNKYLAAGAAMVTAGALVAGPVTQSLPLRYLCPLKSSNAQYN